VYARGITWLVAALLAAGLTITQILLGGWWYAWLAAPGYFLVACGAVLAASLFWKNPGNPGAWCIATTLAFAAYLFWRQSNSHDAYAAREDAWLLLGSLCVYLTVTWQVRGEGPRWLLLGVLFALSVAQVLLAVTQFATDKPFHPMAGLAAQLRLPDGKLALTNLGLITGTMHARTALSGVLEVTTFLALGLLVWGRCAAWVRLLLLWVCTAGFVGMIICLSRSAYVALPTGVAVFGLACFFIVRRGVREHRALFGAGALVLVGSALGLGVATGWESIAVWLRLGEMAVDQYRQDLWTFTVPPMLQLDPVWGSGANTFEDLARRYRGLGFTADPIHAHSDWLQLLIEYGWVGLILGAVFFFVHFFAGWRNTLRLSREAAPQSVWPQSMNLGLASGSLAAMAAIGSHVLFDYSLHLPAVAMLTALCAGFIAACRPHNDTDSPFMPRWLGPLALMPAVPGFLLAVWLWRDAPAEKFVLAAENALVSMQPDEVSLLAQSGLTLSPDHPRLLFLAGLAAQQESAQVASGDVAAYARAADKTAALFRLAVTARPSDVFVWKEAAQAFDAAAFAWEALAEVSTDPARSAEYGSKSARLFMAARQAQLHCIARDPDHARGYEGLARHYLLKGQNEEAARLARLASTLAGTRQARQILEFLSQISAEP